jgi:hypothetical protein
VFLQDCFLLFCERRERVMEPYQACSWIRGPLARPTTTLDHVPQGRCYDDNKGAALKDMLKADIRLLYWTSYSKEVAPDEDGGRRKC